MNQTIKELIEAKQSSNQALHNHLHTYRVFIKISKEEFWKLLKLHSQTIFLERNNPSPFLHDSNNIPVIADLYKYLVGDPTFMGGKGNLFKGILLTGNFGTGKTVLLKSFCNIVMDLTPKRVSMLHAKEIPAEIKKHGLEHFYRRPMLIDDLGKEAKELNDYGTIIKPIVDLMSVRYDHGGWTFATANYKLDSFKQFYGETISERFIEMFNILELTGKSRRK